MGMVRYKISLYIKTTAESECSGYSGYFGKWRRNNLRKILLQQFGGKLFILFSGHPNEMFRFPSPSTRNVGSVGRIKKGNQKLISK